jgi:rod shape determining protein RodA
VLCFLGLAFIWSASSVLTPDGVVHPSRLLKQQAVWLLVGLAAAAGILLLDYNLIKNLAYLLYGVGIGLLILVFLFGTPIRGAQRWLKLGGYQLQPSELVKIAVVLALARYLMYRRNYRTLPGLIPPFLLVLIPMGLIIVQPDLGTASVLLPALFAMLYAAGARMKHLLVTVAAGLASLPLLWFTVMSEFQRNRILAFLSPQHDALRTGFHTIQSLIAIGSGGLLGKGFAAGPQNLLNLVPAAHTDFIFAVIAEEWGLMGGLMVLVLFFILFSRGVEIAGKTREPFGRLAVVGGVTILAFQTALNIGMTMRLCPITGVTLPFVSYGGSSLLSSFIMVALILNVGMRTKQVVAPDDFE